MNARYSHGDRLDYGVEFDDWGNQGPERPTGSKLTGCAECSRYALYVFNIIFMLGAAAVSGVAVWIAVTRNYMSNIIGTTLFTAGIFLLISAGGIVFLVSFLGCCGALMRSKVMLSLYVFALVVTLLMLGIAGVLAFIFRSQLGNRMKAYMSTTLETQYGVRQEDGWNRAITWSWDQTQSRLSCCAVDDRGWSLYRLSAWYRETPGEPGRGKAFVPPSCCVTNPDGSYYNRELCQKNNLGPPGENNGANSALFFRGCYGAGVDWLYYNSRYILIFGFTALGCLVFGIIASGYLLSFIKD